MAFNVEILDFDGPLDLMLHLIDKQKLDILDLDMTILCEQYIAYIKQMEDLKLEIESEYLVELAHLVEYKSKLLLPKPKLDENVDELDAKEKLVQRLLEYQKYKEVSKILYENFIERQDQISKSSSVAQFSKQEFKDDEPLNGNPYDLLKAMQKVLKRAQLSKPLETKFTEKEISAEDRMLEIKSRLIDLPESFTFEKLVEDCKTMQEYVVTFLAILVMAKDHYIVFEIDEDENILFRRGVNND